MDTHRYQGQEEIANPKYKTKNKQAKQWKYFDRFFCTIFSSILKKETPLLKNKVSINMCRKEQIKD